MLKLEPSLESGYKELHIWLDFAKGSSFKIEDDSYSKVHSIMDTAWKNKRNQLAAILAIK